MLPISTNGLPADRRVSLGSPTQNEDCPVLFFINKEAESAFDII